MIGKVEEKEMSGVGRNPTIKITYKDGNGKEEQIRLIANIVYTVSIGIAVIPIKELKFWMKLLYDCELINMEVEQ